MKKDEFIAKTLIGIEDIAMKEIDEILNIKASSFKNGRIFFKTNKINSFIKKTRSVNVVYRVLTKFSFKNLDDIKNNIDKIDFSFIKEDFVVRCDRKGNHDFRSIDIQNEIGEIIYNKGYKVNLNSKNIIYFDIEDDKCYVGILLAKDLCKRDYRIRINNQGLNACLSYSLLRIASWKKSDSLLDPFCKDGLILIEAALLGGKKIFGLDDKNAIKNADVNARYANVKINFSNNELDWLDTKFKKNEVDFIITKPILASKRQSIKDVERAYRELFHQASYILKNKLVLVVENDELIKEHAKDFKLVEERVVYIGSLMNKVLVFEK